ncbi:MAG: hypothetical protein HUU03_06995 [Planctomycetaceae bacterium]|nr:hypothetical protein [Planctomycetota bacterium]NUO16172.1 hypothetical protein [Planctomycetaceae bacterium]GIK53659.1 MAG: hypothetical protein BroJett014_26320 [Planctomycetota bacterium]
MAENTRTVYVEGRIELRLKELNQLFDSFDPAPFHEKDLDQDAEEFIVSWAREYPTDTPLTFILHLPENQRASNPEETVSNAIRNYFTYRVSLARLELKRLLQQGRTSLLVGLAFLAACMGAREILKSFTEQQGWMVVFEEGLLIIGWVAMWKPLEILLYDWWPVRRRVRTYENLAKMKVEVRYATGAVKP